MTLPQVRELMAYWESWPPLHVLIACCLRGPRREAQNRRHAGAMPLPEGEGGAALGGLLALAPGGICRLEDWARQRGG